MQRQLEIRLVPKSIELWNGSGIAMNPLSISWMMFQKSQVCNTLNLLMIESSSTSTAPPENLLEFADPKDSQMVEDTKQSIDRRNSITSSIGIFSSRFVNYRNRRDS